MNPEDFRAAPWRSKHAAYEDGPLELVPAPEYANSEVVLAGLYRASHAFELSEGAVPQRGRELDRLIKRHRERMMPLDGAVLDAESLHLLLNSTLASPKLPNQSSRRFLQVTPLVPATAIFSGSARTTGNPWSPGRLVERMIWLGSATEAQARERWAQLFEALSVQPSDDIFARFLEAELGHWTSVGTVSMAELKERPQRLAQEDFDASPFPARQFVQDLPAIIRAKPAMTRRQWTSMLEAVVRLAVVSHVFWIEEMQYRIWTCLREALFGAGPRTAEQARDRVFGAAFQYLSYGDRALPALKDRTSLYLRARLGINRVLFALEASPAKLTFASSAGIAGLCSRIRSELMPDGRASTLLNELEDIYEDENRTILCNKGIGANILEFARHVLGQRQAAEELLRDYDQGYVLRKKTASKTSPWIVALGPVAAISAVHCSFAGVGGPRSVRRLSQHLAAYGVVVGHHEIARNDLGHQLRMLGLVLDSPDAESGMLLVPPFPEHVI